MARTLKTFRNIINTPNNKTNLEADTDNNFCIIIFTNPSVWSGYDTMSIFKQSLTGLNSEFSFF